MLYSYLHVHSASQRHNIKDRHRNEGRMIIKMQEGRHKKISLTTFYLSLYCKCSKGLFKGCWRVACERMQETERKLHILTPLLWPSRCVLFSWCWGPLHRGFPRAPSVGCGLPLLHLVSTVWNYTGNSIGGFREPPRSGVAFLTTSGLYCLEFYWQLLWDPNSS